MCMLQMVDLGEIAQYGRPPPTIDEGLFARSCGTVLSAFLSRGDTRCRPRPHGSLDLKGTLWSRAISTPPPPPPPSLQFSSIRYSPCLLTRLPESAHSVSRPRRSASPTLLTWCPYPRLLCSTFIAFSIVSRLPESSWNLGRPQKRFLLRTHYSVILLELHTR